MPKFIGAIKLFARLASCGMACRTTISPEAYQPLSTLETKKQLVNAGAAPAGQSGWPGLLSTLPLVVSYHWYKNPSYRCRCDTSVSVAWTRACACCSLMMPRSRAETTAHRYTPMSAAEVYRPYVVGVAVPPAKVRLSIGRLVAGSMSTL